MAAPLKKVRASYSCSIEGTLGRFVTPSGTVAFFQTRATLLGGETTQNSRLTSYLAPAREALDAKEMDFNQLLQRDLDDHRIAHELVPYLLQSPAKAHGPAFFPPIVAALLPFRDRRPVNELPALVTSDLQDDPNYPGVHWRFLTAGDVFQLQEQQAEDGSRESSGFAVLRWNDERAKLVIMDGQHRAMAMLAIHRTHTNAWAAAASGYRYRAFYEEQTKSLLSELRQSKSESVLKALEFPVTICLFDDYTGSGRNPHAAARKLFVDVNKEAKPPSESRLILLSDVRLDHVLARELLNHLRASSEGTKFPLFAVEYDNPEPRSFTPRRWNAVTNLEILLRAVDVSCFGPAEPVQTMEFVGRGPGKPSLRDKNEYFRAQMRLQDVPGIDAKLADGPREIDRLQIGRDLFPVYNQEARRALLARFFTLWGHGLLRLLSEIEPYRAHIEAAKNVRSKWGPSSDVKHELAYEALFDGVGMFWTLELGDKHWREQTQHARVQKTKPPVQTDVSIAWQYLETTLRSEFEKERARCYLESTNEEDVRASKEFFADQAITYAAQVGLVMAWATLRWANPGASHEKLLEAVIGCINRALASGPTKSRNRRLLFLKTKRTGDFNLLPKMDSSFATYYRVFWFELLCMAENEGDLKAAGADTDGLKGLLKRGRRLYFKKVVQDQTDLYRAANRSVTDEEKIQSEGRERAIEGLAQGYHHWFAWPIGDARATVRGLVENESDGAGEEEADAEDENSES